MDVERYAVDPAYRRMVEGGRKGGRSRSKAKLEAVRRNVQRAHGRPRQDGLAPAWEKRGLSAQEAETVNVRVLAATSMDLAGQVVSGAFHAEWYEYLAPHRLEVPPLRERPEDIALLAQRFAQALMRKIGQAEVPLETAVVEQLQSYGYPGNVRELKTIIERALIESGGRPFGVEHLHLPS